MAASSTLSADVPGVLGLDEVLRQVAQDDQEEWEYEYSATETEVVETHSPPVLRTGADVQTTRLTT